MDHRSIYISKIFQRDIVNIFLSISFNINFVLVAQKNRLIETVLLGIHNICSGRHLNICLGAHKNRLIETVL